MTVDIPLAAETLTLKTTNRYLPLPEYVCVWQDYRQRPRFWPLKYAPLYDCLLYTSDAADEMD